MKLLLLLLSATLAAAQFGFPKIPSRIGETIGSIPGKIPTGGVSFPSLEIPKDFNGFKTLLNKTYATVDEEVFRMKTFKENAEKIASLNEAFGKGAYNFVMQANELADLALDEFNKLFNGYKNSLRSKINIPPALTFTPDKATIPDSVDWRESGAVSPVKSQGQCASCWAFVAAGALEGHTFRKTGKLNELSPQDLMDCSTKQGTEGCEGGLMEPAYEYVRINKGVDTYSAYPYESKNGDCRFKSENVGATCKGYAAIPSGDEKALEAAVATKGPVAVAIDAGRQTFQFYKEGVYYDPACTSVAEQLNHAVLVVGYGKEANGQKYWLLKNTYGPTWGIGGYMKLAKDAKNHCGIATQATYPLV